MRRGEREEGEGEEGECEEGCMSVLKQEWEVEGECEDEEWR